ncbi:MAG: helix-turn-helix transcriptional regulator [Acidiferrobacter sp.]
MAARLGVCRRTVEKLLAEGRLPPPARFGRARRWGEGQIETVIQAEIERAEAGGRAQRARRGREQPRMNH